MKADARELKKVLQNRLQGEGGMNRREARRATYGNTRRESESQPTRGQSLNLLADANRLKRRQAAEALADSA